MTRNKRAFREAKKLRKQGKSYSEINKHLGIPKSTLSNWFSDIEWSQSIKAQLINRWSENNANRLIKINKSRKLQTLRRHNQYREQASQEFEKLKSNPLFLTGLSIYWGEGEKAERGRVAVINTDANLLKVVVNFYRKVLRIPNSKLRAAMFLYKDHNQKDILRFWSRKIKIPTNQFIKTQTLPSRSRLTKRKSKNGMCNVYFSSTEMNVKIRHWIKLLSIEMRE